MINIKTAKFITSAVLQSQYPEEGLPEIALVGRSNVGKSSLINTIVNRRNLARTSCQPGRTQTINFYLLNEEWYFVDLPGYGYAKVPLAVRDNWKEIVERYLPNRSSLKAIWQLIDVRHPPTDKDRQMFEWISHFSFPKLVIATKLDKISKGQRSKQLAVIRNNLPIKPHELIMFSSQTREGKDELLQWVERLLDSPTLHL